MKISNTATDCQTSEVILREQRQICRERFFSNPGLIIGLTVFILIALAAIIIPAAVNVDPNEMAIADRLKGPSLYVREDPEGKSPSVLCAFCSGKNPETLDLPLPAGDDGFADSGSG